MSSNNQIDSQEVVNRLAQMMQAQGMTAGDRLPSIRQLALTMKVSPSVIRDAMVRAQAMGVVKLYPRSGAFVQSVATAPAVDSLAATLPSALQQLDQNVIYLLDTRRILGARSGRTSSRTPPHRRSRSRATIARHDESNHEPRYAARICPG